MKNSTISRVTLWAMAGLLISIGWGLCFANANKAVPVEPLVYLLASLTQPAAGIALYLKPSLALGITWVVIANVATFALLGLIVESVRRHPRTLRTSH